MRLLVIDSYDSFTYNLAQYPGEPGAELLARRNDEVSLEEILRLHPDRIVVSPDPCTPDEDGISLEVVEKAPTEVSMLGKTAKILHDGRGVHRGLPRGFEATRHHSLVIEPESVPDCLVVTLKNFLEL